MAEFVIGGQSGPGLGEWVPDELWEVVREHGHQKALPLIARTPELAAVAGEAARSLPSEHRGFLGDSRLLDHLPDESVHLVVTSPPYWNLKPYEAGADQLGSDRGLRLTSWTNWNRVWRHCLRALCPGAG